MSLTLSKISEVFPKALGNKKLVSKVSELLKPHGFGTTTQLATSLCCDELCRPLERDFGGVYGQNFSMGGLAGFSFGGVTSFGAMAAHIPDGGSCLICYGPHVGVCKHGKVGTVERKGRVNGGACCGSAVAASGYVGKVHKGEVSVATPPADAFDGQQALVGSMLLPYAEKLEKASDRMVELPYSLFDAQNKLMSKIVSAGAPNVTDGHIALLGGIQINTPEDMEDHFLPLRFDLLNNKGQVVANLLKELD